MITRNEYLEWYHRHKSLSGYFAKEKWQREQGTYEQFLEIYQLTDYLPKEAIFRERIYHLENNIFESPKCECGGLLNFSSGNVYGKKCRLCDHRGQSRDKFNNGEKSKWVSYFEDDVTLTTKEFVVKFLLNKNGKPAPSSTNKQWYINRNILYRYEEIEKIKVDNNIPELKLTLDFIVNEKRCGECDIVVYSDREFCSPSCKSKSKIVREKTYKTCREKYGVENPFQVKEFIQKITDKKQEKWLQQIDKKLFEDNHIKPMFEFNGTINAKEMYNVKCTKCDQEFQTRIWFNAKLECKNCDEYHASYGEREIYNFLIQYLHPDDIIMRHRKTFVPVKIMEVDFYLPKYNLAIEFNGLYYHSEFTGGKDKLYHLTKTNICEQFGIRLIHIFEDEWIAKQDIIKSRILNMLNMTSNKIYARKCEVKEISSKIKNEFLNLNHIQGEDLSSIKLGLYYNEELVSIMSFAKPRLSLGKKKTDNLEFELSRFCSKLNSSVIGGAGKLFEYFKKNYDWNKIYSYADKRWSTGNVYKQLNMILEHETSPGYWYSKNKKRYHRFGFMKQNLPKLFPDCDMSKTELMIMLENGFDRVWDCGNYKFYIEK